MIRRHPARVQRLHHRQMTLPGHFNLEVNMRLWLFKPEI
jgi:hypothetical protein